MAGGSREIRGGKSDIAGQGEFQRVEVVGGKMLPGNMQEMAGIQPGQQVVANALVLQFTAQQ
jgi:hypothetical protein